MREDYPLFMKWTKIMDWILDTIERFPKNTKFTLGDRIINHSLDIMETIIEAIYTKKRKDLLSHLNLAIEKLRVLFRICHQRKLISNRQYEFISLELNEAGQMVGGWIKHETAH